MNAIYKCLRWFNKRWYLWLTSLIAVTIILHIWGDAGSGKPFRLSSSIYGGIRSCVLDFAESAATMPWQTELSRWTGFAVWFSAIAAVVTRLFEQPLLTVFAGIAARRHIILAGLGEKNDHAERLVVDLCDRGYSVLVIEDHHDHPGIQVCRDAGAVVLVGTPTERMVLQKAQLRRATHLLCLFEEDTVNLETALTAKKLLRRDKQESQVVCVVQISDPGLMESVRKHSLYTDRRDRQHFELVNMHEVTARSMLREAIPRIKRLYPRRILVVGTGAKGRLGETLVLRATKDWWIDHHGDVDGDGTLEQKIEIDVYDQDADNWIANLKERYPLIEKACILRGRRCIPEKCGFQAKDETPAVIDADYHSIFVCLAEEAHAMVQANRLFELFSRQPQDQIPIIVVRVVEREHGCGALLSERGAGGLGKGIRPIGMRERVFDVDTVLQPEAEMRAQTMHEEYVRKLRMDIAVALRQGKEEEADALLAKPAVKFWDQLAPTYQESNRALAGRLLSYLEATDPQKKPRKYMVKPMVGEFGAGRVNKLFEFSPDEVEFLAALEHRKWMEERTRDGWRYGETRDEQKKLHPQMVEWDDPRLAEDIKDYDREFIRRIPHVLAKADYEVVPMDG